MAGVWARGASTKKFGTRYVFLQPLKLANSNLVHNLGLGPSLPKTTFWTKIGGGLDQGSIQKNLGSLCISAIVEASNFKFGTQIGFGTSLPKTTFRTKISGDMGWGSTPKNWDPLRISAAVETSNFKFGLQLGFGTILITKHNV